MTEQELWLTNARAIISEPCPPCKSGDHRNCLDGDVSREQAEFESFYGDLPPWWGCECPCQESTLCQQCGKQAEHECEECDPTTCWAQT